MSYSLGAETDPAPTPASETDTAVVLQRVDKTTTAIQQWTVAEDKRRKIALIVAGASAVFAMLKLGWVVIPWFRQRRSAAIGQLGAAPSSNPARRRRRRRR